MATSKDEILMKAILDQVDASSFTIDYDVLAAAIGAPTKGAASTRWSRFKTKLGKIDSASGGSNFSPSKPSGVTKRTPKKVSGSTKKGKKGSDHVEGEDDELVIPTPSKKGRSKVKPENGLVVKSDNMLLGGPVKDMKSESHAKFTSSRSNDLIPSHHENPHDSSDDTEDR